MESRRLEYVVTKDEWRHLIRHLRKLQPTEGIWGTVEPLASTRGFDKPIELVALNSGLIEQAHPALVLMAYRGTWDGDALRKAASDLERNWNWFHLGLGLWGAAWRRDPVECAEALSAFIFGEEC